MGAFFRAWGVTRSLSLMKERKSEMPKMTNEEREKAKERARIRELQKGPDTFMDLAKEAKAVYHIKRIVLVNTEKLDEYIELMCADDPEDI